MIHQTREEELAFLKRLWRELPTVCPKCGGAELTYLHKKPRKATMTGNALPAEKYTAP